MNSFRSKNKYWSDNRGITLFISVTIMALLLFVSFAVSNIALKSLLFSSAGKDSQTAFFAADAGIECALYWDSKWDPSKFDTSSPGSPITCGGKTLNAGDPISGTSTVALIGGGIGSTNNIAFVGPSTTNSENTGAQSNTIASGAFDAIAGNLIVVAIRYERNAGQNITNVTDLAGNAYSPAASLQLSSPNGNANLSIWYAKGVTARTSNTVTVTFSGNTSYRNIITSQYSGVDTSSPVDVTATGLVSSGGTVTSNSFSTNQPVSVIVAAAQASTANTSANWTAGSGYIKRNQTSPSQVLGLEDNITSSAQSSVTASLSHTVSGAPKSIVVVAFKAGSTGGGGGSPTNTSVFGFGMDGGLTPTPGCAIVTVTKNSNSTYIKSRGYNTCSVSPRRIERGLEVTY